MKDKLKQQAHHLKPIILIGSNGLTDAVLNETERALDDHELIKIKINGADREGVKKIAAKLTEVTGAKLIQQLGHTVAVYRKAPEGNK